MPEKKRKKGQQSGPDVTMEARIAVLEELFVRHAPAGTTDNILGVGFASAFDQLDTVSRRLEPVHRIGQVVPDALNGLYRGSVLDNVDPEHRYRLQIQVASLNDTLLPWAEACTSAAQFSAPSIGDTVWVMFEAGDIQYPVWVGVLPASAA